MDHRRLNNLTRNELSLCSYDDAIETLAGSTCRLFSTLAIKNAYWLVEMNAKSKEKTVFSIESGL